MTDAAKGFGLEDGVLTGCAVEVTWKDCGHKLSMRAGERPSFNKCLVCGGDNLGGATITAKPESAAKSLEIKVRVTDTAEFREFVDATREFMRDYAWHVRACAAIDPDGEWRLGNPPCDCGFEEAREVFGFAD